MVIEARKNPVN